MIEITTPDALLAALRGSRRVGIDGIDGCGKTTLAKIIAAKLGRKLFSLDDYLEKDKGKFIEFIDYAKLCAEADAAGEYVIEGVCLLRVLQRAGLGIDNL